MLLNAVLLAVLTSLSLAAQPKRPAGGNGPNFVRQQPQQLQRTRPLTNGLRANANAVAPIGKRPAAVAGGRGCKPCESSSSSYYQMPQNPRCGDCNRINVIPDAGFYSFSYAGSNTFSPRSFYICTDRPLFLSVTNCFLQGDYFEVFDNGQPILITNEGNNFPDYPTLIVDPVNDPSTCLASLDFNHGSAVLNPGTHLLTIMVGASWYSGGAGFLRVDTACLINGVMQPCCMAEEPEGKACPQFIVA